MDIKHLLSLNPLSPPYAQLNYCPQAQNRTLGLADVLGRRRRRLAMMERTLRSTMSCRSITLYLEPFALAEPAGELR